MHEGMSWAPSPLLCSTVQPCHSKPEFLWLQHVGFHTVVTWYKTECCGHCNEGHNFEYHRWLFNLLSEIFKYLHTSRFCLIILAYSVAPVSMNQGSVAVFGATTIETFLAITKVYRVALQK